MHRLFARLFSSPSRRRPTRPRRSPLRLEMLETRLAPAVITVTTAGDDQTPNDGTVSLREAILAINDGSTLSDPDIANQNPGTFGTNDTIHFSINPKTILVGSTGLGALPTLAVPVVIDGTTEPGFNGKPLVVVNGANAGPNANGFDIELGEASLNNTLGSGV